MKEIWRRILGSNPTGFNESGATARFTNSFTWAARLAFAALILILAFLGLIIHWLVYPYDSFVISEPGPIITDEFTSNGIPIIRVGEDLLYTTNFCNEGVDTIVFRRADVHGFYFGPDGQPATFDKDNDVISASYGLSQIDFFNSDPTCVEDFVINVRLPNDLPVGAYYSLRNDNMYNPNPLREIVETSETEVFLYVEEGTKAP